MTDAAYYAQRERAERALAEVAVSPKVSALHLEMAAKYSQLAEAHSVSVPQVGSYRTHAA